MFMTIQCGICNSIGFSEIYLYSHEMVSTVFRIVLLLVVKDCWRRRDHNLNALSFELFGWESEQSRTSQF
jgi:hypothetical protein